LEFCNADWAEISYQQSTNRLANRNGVSVSCVMLTRDNEDQMGFFKVVLYVAVMAVVLRIQFKLFEENRVYWCT